MKTKLWLFLIALPLVFTACEKGDDFGFGPTAGKGIKGKARLVAELTPQDCQVDGVTPLIAGQHNEVGKVTVKHDGVNIVVTYETDPGWFITETHLHIGKNSDNFPLNSAGNPMIGNFMFGNDSEFKVVDGNKVLYTIPWYDGCWYIAAHAVVKGAGSFSLDAFAELLPETATIQVKWPIPANNPDAYFPEVKVTNAGILNGQYLGWCIQTDKTIQQNTYLTVNIKSSYEDLSAFGYDETFMMRLNWLLNLDFVGQGYTYGEVQIAIWTLKHGKVQFDDANLAGMTATNPLNPNYIGHYDPAKINEILNQAAEIEHYEPGCGDLVALVIIHDQQDLIIGYPFPCGSETAWGQGCRFVEQGNWAMYFKVCL